MILSSDAGGAVSEASALKVNGSVQRIAVREIFANVLRGGFDGM
jgi:hypothetical protein